MLRRSGVRPAVRAALTLTCLPLLAACAAAEDSDPEPEAVSSTATASPTEAEDEEGPSARKQWADALATRSDPIAFSAGISATGDNYLGNYVSTEGTWQGGPDMWSGTSTAVDAQTGESFTYQFRSRRSLMWMHAAGTDSVLAEKWLLLMPGEFPVGQLALFPGKPLYLSVLDDVEHVSSLEPDDGAGTIEGTIPLDEALGLFGGPLADELGFRDPTKAHGDVELNIDLVGRGVEGYRIAGADLLAAVRKAGGDAGRKAGFVDQMSLEVDLEDDAPPPHVRPPDLASVITSAELPSSV